MSDLSTPDGTAGATTVPEAPSGAPVSPSDPIAEVEAITVPVLAERASVHKRDVTTGRVRVVTHAETVETVVRDVLQADMVEVTRVAVDRPVVGPPPQIRTLGDVTIVPVLEEVLVVEKRLMLKEEIHLRRRVTEEAVAVPVTLRQQTATVERTD